MVERITIAALLHDIGKLYQRGRESIATDSDLYRKHENLMTLICPENHFGGLGYIHAFWTYKFFEDFKGKFKELMQNLNEEFSTDSSKHHEDNIINLSIYHHYPHSELQALIQMADWWSSGLDRRDTTFAAEATSEIPLNFGKYAFRKRPLESIFQNISLNGNAYNERYAYEIKPLTLDKENIFPFKLQQSNIHDLTEEYRTLYKDFTDDFQKVPAKNYRAFINTVDYVLKKFTWCIPSSTYGLANVSLYNHLKTTAGIATCLYEYKIAKELNDEQPYSYNSSDHRIRIKEKHYPVLLTCIDISGIQSFIYNIASQKAAVSLKGRSYYLHLLMESVLSQILQHKSINLSNIQTIYSSGGKAYLFLPNTEKVKAALKEIKVELEMNLWNTHNLSLYVCIGTVPFRYRFDKQLDGSFKSGIVTIAEKNIQMEDLWKRASEEAAKDKSRKFEGIISGVEENEESIFHEVFGNGGEGIELEHTKKFDACTAEPLYDDNFVNISRNQEKPVYVSKTTDQQIELGRVLKDADFNFSFSDYHKFEDKTFDTRARFSIRPINGSRGFHLFDNLDLIKENVEFRKIVSSADVHCTVLNRTDMMKFAVKGYNASYGFSFYGGNIQPKEANGELKTFHQLAQDNSGDTKLGILRMDVDNLGSIFIRGLDPALKTFSAYSTLSFQLDLFFSGYLNAIRNSDQYKDHVSILYSGGDDVFAIGRWDKVLQFGLDIRTEFKEFTSQNPDIDISAGYLSTGSKFPISKSATMTGEAEDAAKKFERIINGQKKNRSAISLFGITVGWEEWNSVLKYKQMFEEIIQADESGKSILHKIITTKSIKFEQEYNPRIEQDFSYIWRILYYLKRYAKNENKNHIEILLKHILHKNQSRNLDLMAVAARWVELLDKLNK